MHVGRYGSGAGWGSAHGKVWVRRGTARRKVWARTWYAFASSITTQCLFASMGLGTENPFEWSALMKAYSLSAERREMYSHDA